MPRRSICAAPKTRDVAEDRFSYYYYAHSWLLIRKRFRAACASMHRPGTAMQLVGLAVLA